MKPLLASPVDLSKLQYPCYASPKYDGFRCLTDQFKGPVTRSLKPIANNFVRGKLGELNLPFLDGELLTYTGGKLDDFNAVQSKLSSRSGLPDFKFMVFDSFKEPSTYYDLRLAWLEQVLGPRTEKCIELVQQVIIENEEELLEYEQAQIELGWEGVMVRSINGKYKFGRSTVNEGILLKLKRFDEDEAEIIGFAELMHNANEATTNELGQTERSSHKENMVGRETLGSISVRWKDEIEFEIGTGFTAALRERLWKDATSGTLCGKTVTFSFQGIGSQGRPRFPVFKGFRHDLK